jgi:methylmalonyl-CoA mutase
MNAAEPRSAARGEPGIEAWRLLVRKALGDRDPSVLASRTRDGIVIEPLYERRREARPCPGRGARAWTVVQIVDDADPDEANAQAHADLECGASGLSLRLAGAPSAAGHGLPPDAAALRIALERIDFGKVHVRLEPHADAPAAARWLSDIALKSGIAPELTDIAFGLDPVAALAREASGAGPDPREFGGCVRELSAAGFRGPFALLDGRVYSEAGATEGQELASILATAVWWLRALPETGSTPADGLALLGASLAVDRDIFLSIAKLRALRLLWARLQELCGAPPTPLHIHAETSRRMLTRADPHANLLRTTLAAFAAAVGGADAITVLPHTAALGRPDSDARALARNVQLLLIEEAHLHRVADAGGGSGVIEPLTDALAEHAWTEFQKIEIEGGIVASLRAAAFQERIAEARAALEKEVADAPLVGATVYRGAGIVAAAPPARQHALAELGLAPIRLEDLTMAAA